MKKHIKNTNRQGNKMASRSPVLSGSGVGGTSISQASLDPTVTVELMLKAIGRDKLTIGLVNQYDPAYCS